MVWQVAVPGMHTVTVTNASFMVVKVCGAGPASTTMGCTLFACCVGFTVTVAVPDLLGSCTEVAVIVANSVTTPPEGAVNRPELEMVPALAAQVTAELKFPVPITVAEHWLVCPYMMVEGEQVTLTEVIDDAATAAAAGAASRHPQRTATTSSRPILLTQSSP